MTKRSNEERLKILQDRLAQINQEGKTEKETVSAEEAVQATNPLENTQKIESVQKADTEEVSDSTESTTLSEPPPAQSSRSLLWLRNLLILAGIGFGIYYVYTNLESIKEGFSPSSSDQEEKVVENKEDLFVYNFSFSEEYTCVILLSGNFLDEESAKKVVNQYKEWGLDVNYVFLPDVSNSKEKTYKVYIGPYLEKIEAENWQGLLNDPNEILDL